MKKLSAVLFFLISGVILIPFTSVFAAVSTTMVVIPQTITYGDTVNFRAQLLNGAGNPIQNKTVNFYIDGTFVAADTGTSNVSNPTLGNAVKLNQIVPLGSKNQGTHSITATFAGDGGFSSSTATGNLVIVKTPLSITAQSDIKNYDGSTSSSSLPVISSGSLKYSDTLNFIQQFLSKIIGMNKTIVPTGVVIDGNSGNNYTVTTINSTTGRINTIPLTVSGITGVSKIYNGNNSATINTGSASLVGAVMGDDVHLDFSGVTTTFVNKNVGTAKPITITGVTLTGSDAANYTLSLITGVTADITPAPLTVLGTAVSNKEYDATMNATVISSGSTLSGAIGLDTVTLGTAATGTFDTKHVGTAKPVIVTGFTISGTDAPNYQLSQPVGLTADITQKDITVSFIADNKIYDGLLTATGTFSDTRISGDVLTVSNTGITFDTKIVGVNKTVTASGLSISGTDAGNYHLTNTTTTDTADILVRTLIVVVTGTDKVYDSNRQAVITLADDRVSGDNVVVSYLQSKFGTKNVGPHKNVTVLGITLSGTDAVNYTTTSSAQDLDVAITPRPLTITAILNNKVYDGNLTAGVVSLMDDRIAGDSVGIISSTSAAFTTKDVGTAKSATVNILISSGADNSNYNIPSSVSTSANITQRTLTVSAVGDNKEYDATTHASATVFDNRVSGDIFTTSYGSAMFNNASAGAGKTITVSGLTISGVDARNYSVAPTSITTTGNITQKPITITVNNLSKELGQVDPVLTAVVIGLVSPDTTSGALIRDVGETIGMYAVNQGTFTAGANYLETFTPGVFIITKKSQAITINPVTMKNFGDADFGITGTATSGLAPIFSLDVTSTGICSLSAPQTVHILNLGNCTVLANQAGNIDYFAAPTASIIVPIVDSTGPTITLLGSNPMTVEVQTGTYVEAGATAADNHYSGSPAVIISGAVNNMVVGSYSILYSSTDDYHNTNTVTRTVNVVDTIKPIITLNGVNPVTVHTGDAYIDAGATAVDAYNGTLTPISTDTVNTLVEGTYSVNYNVQDSSMNTANTVIRTVHVVNADAPVFSLLNITQEAISPSGNTIDYGVITATDAIDGVISASCTPLTNTMFAVGTTTVLCTSTNSHTIMGTGSFTVTTADTTVPVITVPATQTFEATGTLTTPTLITATATDIVSGSVTTTPSTVMFTKGTHVVTWTATDSHSNTASATSNVIITDTTAPVIAKNGDAAITIPYGSIYADLGAIATDTVDGIIPVITSGDMVNTAIPGTYIIRYNVSDLSLNAAVEVIRMVIVSAPPSSGGSSGGTYIIPTPKIDGGSTIIPEVLGAATFKFTCDISYKRKISCDTNDVIELQKVLKAEKLYEGKLSGKYTYQTFIAVKAYQKKYGIEPISGFIGVKTRTQLNK